MRSTTSRSISGSGARRAPSRASPAQHGGADWDTRSMIHTIGVSFTTEMVVKAAYEETIGRVTAWLRGPRKTPQDAVVADMAADYAAFLRQTPWYQYPFNREARELWAAPVEQSHSRMGDGVSASGWSSRRRPPTRRSLRARWPPPRRRSSSSEASSPDSTRTALARIPDVTVDRRARGRRRDRDAALRPVHANPRRHRSTGRRDPRDRRQRRDHGERDRAARARRCASSMEPSSCA